MRDLPRVLRICQDVWNALCEAKNTHARTLIEAREMDHHRLQQLYSANASTLCGAYWPRIFQALEHPKYLCPTYAPRGEFKANLIYELVYLFS